MRAIKVLGLDIYGCHEALERLDAYVDRELVPDEVAKVRQHLKICRECARKFTFEEELTRGLKNRLGRLELPDEAQLKAKIGELLEREIQGEIGGETDPKNAPKP